jgi:hypothetical protein
MDTRELIANVYRKTTGELDPSVTPESEDGQTVLSIINEQIDYYYNAVDRFGQRIIWARNIDPTYVVGDTSAGETSYDIDWDEVQAFPTGFYMPITVAGKRYDLVPFNELWDPRHENERICAITANGLEFAVPPKDIGEIVFPCCVKGKHLTGNETDVEAASGVHNILWLQWAAAAEYVRTDMVRGGQYPNVLAQANDAFNRMIADNEARTTSIKYADEKAEDTEYGTYWW